jgi:hypothetical protein
MLIILGIFVIIFIVVAKAIKKVIDFMAFAAENIYDEINDPDYFTNDEN